MKHTILCVDDEIDMVDALERLFRKKYKVLKATSAAEGLALVKENPVALIISDQRMPGKTGVEFLKESIKHCPNAIRILLTGYTDIDSVIDAINSGEVYRYVSKPWDPVDFANTVDKAIERYDLSAELKQKNAQLSAALAELRGLDQAKNKFMILMNHELKTPLTVVLSYLELLHETDLDEEQKKFMSRIEQGAERLKRLVEDSLLFISAETQVLKLSKKKTDLRDLVKKASEIFKDDAEKKHQQFEVIGDKVQMKTDPDSIGKVVERLVGNAVKFGESKSTVELEVTDEDDRVKVAVRNKGKAVSKNIVAALGKSFNLDEDIMKHSEGLGLGLSVSQALLKLHKSQLEFDHHGGKAEVRFYLTKD